MKKELITWIASYPKSGNTWVRMLLAAYYNHGHIDINREFLTIGDQRARFYQSVSSVPLSEMGIGGKLLIRPAALMEIICSTPFRPLFVKTHMANLWIQRQHQLIPKGVTERAIYVVRDPRDVALSYASHMGKTVDEAIAELADDLMLYTNPERSKRPDYAVPHFVNSWSENVRSWLNADFPVLTVRYEDLHDNTEAELVRILEFCGMEVDLDLVRQSVEACRLDKMRKQEEKDGFRERSTFTKRFFGKGGTRWPNEMTPDQSISVIDRHKDMMGELGYRIAECA